MSSDDTVDVENPEDGGDGQRFSEAFLRGADILIFSIVPVGVLTVIPIWEGNPPIHNMFTTLMFINIVSFQIGMLPTVYPSNWYPSDESVEDTEYVDVAIDQSETMKTADDMELGIEYTDIDEGGGS